MDMPYTKEYQVRWSDLDGNSHMKNTSYLEYASQTRMSWFFDMGFPPARMAEMGIGPVAVHDEIFYIREIHLMALFTVSLQIDGLSEDLSRMRLINIFTDGRNKVFSKVISDGVWFNLIERKITPPPAEIKELMMRLPKSESYSVIK